MLISDLLRAINVTYKGKDEEISFITDDSRKCTEKTLFVCHENGDKWLSEAKEKGAVAVVSYDDICPDCIVVADTRKAYAVLCSAFFGNCHKSLTLIGVTGTNGKTTVASMLYSILSLSGKKCGMLTTVSNEYNNEVHSGELTTPDCFSMHRMFSEMAEQGTEYCVLEASSQGLSQQRLYGLKFDTAIFTNLSEDHLDYHDSMENYRDAKKELFKHCERAVINYDDEQRDEFISACQGKIFTYSVKDDNADYTAKCIKFTEETADYAIVAQGLIHRIKVNTPGEFNVANSMAAIIAALECGCTLESCASALRSFSGVKGRMEILSVNAPYKVIIDYAHTPDSMKKVLLSMRNFPKNRVIAVFGCGGDRDKSKRSMMGKIASEFADISVITSDNPRHEEPMSIIDDILSGVNNKKNKVFIKENRTKAIEYALKIAQKNDIILLLGKGHETYIVIGDEKIPYDERDVVHKFIANR